MASSTSSSYRSNGGGGGHYLESGRQSNKTSSKTGGSIGPSVRQQHHYNNSYGGGKRQQSAIDTYLRERSLKRKYIAKDGCCLFRAVAEQVWMVQSSHWTLRRHCALYIKRRKDYFKSFLTEPVEDYCFKLGNSSMWGGEMELVALSEFLNCYIEVYSEDKGRVSIRKFNEKKKTIPGCKHVLLAYIGSNHYDSVWKESDERLNGFCQSIVYELLFSAVFNNEWLTRKAKPLSLRETHFITDPSIKHCSSELLKALSVYVYSNIPLELSKIERQAREYHDRKYASDLQYTVGTVCQVFIDGGSYSAEIVSSDSYPRIQVKLFNGGPKGKKTYNVSTKQISLSSSTRPSTGGGNDKSVTSDYHSKKSYSSKTATTPSSRQLSTTTTTTTPLAVTSNDSTPVHRSLSNKEEEVTRNGVITNREGSINGGNKEAGIIREVKTTSSNNEVTGNREGIIPAVKEDTTNRTPPTPIINNSKPPSSSERSSNNKRNRPKEVVGGANRKDQPHTPTTRSNSQGTETLKSGGGIERSTTPTKRSTTPTKNSVVQRNEKGVGKKYSTLHSSTDNSQQHEPPTATGNQPVINTESNAYYVTPVSTNVPHIDPIITNGPSVDPTSDHYITTNGPAYNNGSGFSYYIPPLLGHQEEEEEGENEDHLLLSVSAFNDAPECEWPILNSVNSSKSTEPNSLHIDGPPPAATEHAPPITAPPINQFPPQVTPIMYSHLIFSELEPPLHLLRNKTQENKQTFLIEYAQKCLGVYTKYIHVTDGDLEDTLEELMCMSVDDITRSSPPRYNDGQFSIVSSSQANSELTEDRETTPNNEPHPSPHGNNGVMSSPPHSEGHTSSPLIEVVKIERKAIELEGEQEDKEEEETTEELKELMPFPMTAGTPFMYQPIPMMLPPHPGFVPYLPPLPHPHGSYRMPPPHPFFYPHHFFPPPQYFHGGPYNEEMEQQENKDEEDETTPTSPYEELAINNHHDLKTTPIDGVPIVVTMSEQNELPLNETPPTSINEKVDQIKSDQPRPSKRKYNTSSYRYKNRQGNNTKRTPSHHHHHSNENK